MPPQELYRGAGAIQGYFLFGRPQLRPFHRPAQAVMPGGALQRHPAPPGSSAARPMAPGDVFEIPPGLLDLRGALPGKPLPEPVRSEMEAVLGASFANVRVHVGPEAASIGALAFAHGSNLYFAPGHFNPHSIQGKRLIAHELTHVVQQRTGRVRAPAGKLAVIQDRGLEAEAERMSLKVSLHRMTAAPAAGHPQQFRGAPRGRSPIQAAFDPNIEGKFSSKEIFTIGTQKFPTMFTGHTYGAEGSGYCAACHGGLHDYDIRSTTTTNAWALTWFGNLEKVAPKDAFMLGVLYAGGRFYGATSGNRDWARDYLPEGIGFIHQAPDTITTRGGFQLPWEDIENCQVTNAPLQCAGAKLVSYAVTKKIYLPYYMTEIWFDPSGSHKRYKNGAIIESCPTCKHLLMALMCPLSSKEASDSRKSTPMEE